MSGPSKILLMNVFEGNSVTDVANGLEFLDYGIVDTVLHDNFFSSDGSAGSTATSISGLDSDTDADIADGNIYQNFFNQGGITT